MYVIKWKDGRYLSQLVFEKNLHGFRAGWEPQQTEAMKFNNIRIAELVTELFQPDNRSKPKTERILDILKLTKKKLNA